MSPLNIGNRLISFINTLHKRCTFNVKSTENICKYKKSRTFASAIRGVAQPG